MDDFHRAISIQLRRLLNDDEVRNDFMMEMSRFIPRQIRERTLDNADYWSYVQSEVNATATQLFNSDEPKQPFDMG